MFRVMLNKHNFRNSAGRWRWKLLGISSMDANKPTEEIHSLGEGAFNFSMPGGRGRLSVTDDALTPFDGLVPWAACACAIGSG